MIDNKQTITALADRIGQGAAISLAREIATADFDDSQIQTLSEHSFTAREKDALIDTLSWLSAGNFQKSRSN